MNHEPSPLRVALFDYGVGNLHSLGKALEHAGADVLVTNDWTEALDRDALVLPGVGAFSAALEALPDDRSEIVERVAGGMPTLGICLGMQFLAGFYGVNVGRVKNPVHGSQAIISHRRDSLFKGIPAQFKAARYNSLGLYPEGSKDLEFIAYEKNSGAVMALKHRHLPFAGLQFHPESFLTEHGEKMIKNFTEFYV